MTEYPSSQTQIKKIKNKIINNNKEKEKRKKKK
jgi:hypothetical protein